MVNNLNKRAIEIAKKWNVLRHESGEINSDILEAIKEAVSDNFILESFKRNLDENNGWSFDYAFLQTIPNEAEEIHEDVNMESTDAVLQRLYWLSIKMLVDIQIQETEIETRLAIDMGGGCSRCGDLTGFECICDEDLEY